MQHLYIGVDVRSVCTKVCKWTYLAHEKRWDTSLLEQLDLDDLVTQEKLGQVIVDLGTAAGALTETAAQELGLTTNTTVAVGMIDHVIRDSAFYPELMAMAQEQGRSEYDILNEEVERLEQENPFFTGDFHLLGYHHGNRSPRANPHLKGMVCGLSLNKDLAELAKVYMAAIQSVSYGTRHIIETMNQAGHQITRIHMCGGGTKNPLWLRGHANVTGCEIVLAEEDEAVILGSAILAATACGDYESLTDAMAAMSSTGKVIKPQPESQPFHDAKYRVFHEMYEDQVKYKAMMHKFS